jgi:multidrug transporter EmrE-like cation transporter
MTPAFLVNAIGLAVTLALSHLLLRYGATMAKGPLEYPRIAFTLTAMLIYVAIFFYYSQLLQRFSLSRLYPVYTALSIVCVYVSGTLFFREPLSLRGLLGTALIIVGVIVVTAERAP